MCGRLPGRLPRVRPTYSWGPLSCPLRKYENRHQAGADKTESIIDGNELYEIARQLSNQYKMGFRGMSSVSTAAAGPVTRYEHWPNTQLASSCGDTCHITYPFASTLPGHWSKLGAIGRNMEDLLNARNQGRLAQPVTNSIIAALLTHAWLQSHGYGVDRGRRRPSDRGGAAEASSLPPRPPHRVGSKEASLDRMGRVGSKEAALDRMAIPSPPRGGHRLNLQ